MRLNRLEEYTYIYAFNMSTLSNEAVLTTCSKRLAGDDRIGEFQFEDSKFDNRYHIISQHASIFFALFMKCTCLTTDIHELSDLLDISSPCPMFSLLLVPVVLEWFYSRCMLVRSWRMATKFAVIFNYCLMFDIGASFCSCTCWLYLSRFELINRF